MSDEPRHEVTLTKADVEWLADGAPWHLPSPYEGMQSKHRIVEACRKVLATLPPEPEPTPFEKAVASGLIAVGAEWRWVGMPDSVFTVECATLEGNARLNGRAALKLNSDGTLRDPESWTCLRPHPDAPKVGDEMVTSYGRDFTVASWEWIDRHWKCRSAEGVTRWLDDLDSASGALSPKPVPAPSAVTSEPPRTEWALTRLGGDGYQHAEPDWVLVRPCDLQPGDVVSWADMDGHEVQYAITHISWSRRDGFLIEFDDDVQIWQPAWSPVLVRRGA